MCVVAKDHKFIEEMQSLVCIALGKLLHIFQYSHHSCNITQVYSMCEPSLCVHDRGAGCT